MKSKYLVFAALALSVHAMEIIWADISGNANCNTGSSWVGGIAPASNLFHRSPWQHHDSAKAFEPVMPSRACTFLLAAVRGIRQLGDTSRAPRFVNLEKLR